VSKLINLLSVAELLNEVKGKVVPARAIEAYCGLEVQPFSFLISALDGVEFCKHHAPAAFLPGRKTSALSIGGWLVSKDGLDDLESGKVFS
jgi:hypothetical protein